MTVESTATTETTAPTSKHITLDAFLDTYKPVKNHFNETGDDESFQSRVYEINNKEVGFIKTMFNLLPKQVWTVLEVGGSTIVTNGYRFVDRAGYMLTEVPADADNIEACEPTEELRLNIHLYVKHESDVEAQSIVEEILDAHVNDVIHDKHYTESHEVEFGEVTEVDGWQSIDLKLSITFGENELIPGDDFAKTSIYNCLTKSADIKDVTVLEVGRLIHSN